MFIFYNLAGTAIGFLSLFMLMIRPLPGKDGARFNAAKRYLTAMFLLTSFSMFVSQFEPRLANGDFEKLSAPMLLFFYLTAQGFLFAILTLYGSRYASRKYVIRVLLPVLPLSVLYTAVFFLKGEDVYVYSAQEFFTRLPSEVLLMMRCLLFMAVIGSVAYTAWLCHKAKAEYHTQILNYFSETDFARSLWLSKLLGCAEALSGWVLLTYFYTTPILEVVVGVLIIGVFIFYIREFREYALRYEVLRPAVGLSAEEAETPVSAPENRKEDNENQETWRRLDAWIARKDKPFTQSKLTIGDVARETGLPRHRLSRHVNSNEDNFCTWINRLRIEEAARLLIESPERSISDIAEATGFCDLPAFSKTFKKMKGVAPRDFRISETFVRKGFGIG